MYYVSRIVTFVAVPALIAAAWFSLHLARANAEFRRGDPDSIARAIVIEPRDTEALALRALHVDYEGGDSTALLARAAALSPLSSAPRIRLGLAAEIRGDYATAERWLLDAARIDRQFEPRWTLANFYFRRAQDARNTSEFRNGRADAPFWKWMRSALEMSYGDRRPAFELCWRMAQSTPDEILSLAIPDTRDATAAYLAFTLDAHRDSIAPVALKLARFHDSRDTALLLAACDALMEDRDSINAGKLWRAMGYSASSAVFNGGFSSVPVNHGFDWRAIDSAGVIHTSIDQPRAAHRISLDGRQPEDCALLVQMVNLQPRARYALKWEARISGIATSSGTGSQSGVPSGIEWRIGDLRAPIAMSQTAPADPASAAEASFTATSEIMPLTLFYRRPSGQARAEGSIELFRVSIDRLP